MLLARAPREKDEKQETESFYLTCPTIDAIFIGKIAVSMERPAKEREQIRKRFYKSIRLTNLWRPEKEPKLRQPFLFGRLSFDENQWYETDGGIRLPVPDGCFGMPSRIDFSSWDLTSLGLSEEQQEEVRQVETPEAMIQPMDDSMGFFGSNALYIRIQRSDMIPDQTGDWPDEQKKSAVRAYLNAMNSHLSENDSDWGGNINYLSEVTPNGGYVFEADAPEDGVGFRFAVGTHGGFCTGYFFLRYSEPDAVEGLVDVMYDAQRLGFWYMNRVLAGIRGEVDTALGTDEPEEEDWTAEPEEEDEEDEPETEALWQADEPDEEAEDEEDEPEPEPEPQAFMPAPERAERPGDALAWARREAARTYSAPRSEPRSLYAERQSAQPTLAEQMLSGGTQLTSGGRSERRRARAEATERRILALQAEKAGLRGIRSLLRRLKLQREIDALSEKLARYRRREEER